MTSQHLDRGNREFWGEDGLPIYDERGYAKWWTAEVARIASLPLVDRLRQIVNKGHADDEGDIAAIEDAIRSLSPSGEPSTPPPYPYGVVRFPAIVRFNDTGEIRKVDHPDDLPPGRSVKMLFHSGD